MHRSLYYFISRRASTRAVLARGASFTACPCLCAVLADATPATSSSHRINGSGSRRTTPLLSSLSRHIRDNFIFTSTGFANAGRKLCCHALQLDRERENFRFMKIGFPPRNPGPAGSSIPTRFQGSSRAKNDDRSGCLRPESASHCWEICISQSELSREPSH